MNFDVKFTDIGNIEMLNNENNNSFSNTSQSIEEEKDTISQNTLKFYKQEKSS